MKTVKELCKEYGYSQTALAKRFGIPLRTVQNWHGGQREPAPYVVPMMEEILQVERVEAARKENWQKMKHMMASQEEWKKNHPRPVRTAEWEKHGYKWRCSACGNKINLDGTPEENGLLFCPGCGAKMKSE